MKFKRYINETYKPTYINGLNYTDPVKQQFADLVNDKIYDALDNLYIEALSKIPELPEAEDDSPRDAMDLTKAIMNLNRCITNIYFKNTKEDKLSEGWLTDDFGDYEVHKLAMDVLFPEGETVSYKTLDKLYDDIARVLEDDGYLMAGDYLEDMGGSDEITRVYKNNE